MSPEANNLAVLNHASFEASRAYNLEHYDISSALQTTLEIPELLAIFSQKIANTVPHTGYLYQNSEFSMALAQGIVTRHSCSYALKIDGMDLGEIKLMRASRFKPQDLKTLEQLLCCLIYPLRNASLYQRALNQAYTDALTQAWNRSAFNETLHREAKLAERNAVALSLIFLDIDHFKTINDQHGHDCGDQALKSVAKWIRQRIRGGDMLFRYGGEEFVMLLVDTAIQGAQSLAEEIRQDIASRTLAYDMETLKLTASLGVATWLRPEALQHFVNRADNAMYIAKKRGRNQVIAAND
ncbi:MAG: GGDEF domain-containing protein [Methylococcales bacterium]|nr:GGDEF domain-containing protein [Methylococcales bacterium]